MNKDIERNISIGIALYYLYAMLNFIFAKLSCDVGEANFYAIGIIYVVYSGILMITYRIPNFNISKIGVWVFSLMQFGFLIFYGIAAFVVCYDYINDYPFIFVISTIAAFPICILFELHFKLKSTWFDGDLDEQLVNV
jgi:hypothetical protein